MNLEHNRPTDSTNHRAVCAQQDDASTGIYNILLQVSAENPRPLYDGDDYFDQVRLIRTQLVVRGTDYTLSERALATVRQQVLSVLNQLEQAGWVVGYEKAYFQQLSPAPGAQWRFQSLPSARTLFHIWLFHPQKPAYAPDTDVRLLEWMRLSPATGS
jgi:hypothetical protein